MKCRRPRAAGGARTFAQDTKKPDNPGGYRAIQAMCCKIIERADCGPSARQGKRMRHLRPKAGTLRKKDTP
jgi:hypothetical protein